MNKDTLNIIVNFDNNFINMAIVFFVSMMKNASTSVNYKVYILTDNLSKSNFEKLNYNLKDYNNIKFEIIDLNNMLNKYSFSRAWRSNTIVNYCRLFIPELFPDFDKVLYLDVDMIVNRNIEELYNIEIDKECYIAAVSGYATRGMPSKGDEEHIKKIIPDLNNMELYFNDGMFLINLKKIREEGFYNRDLILKMCAQELLFADQDILNIIYHGKVHYLDVRWNVGMVKNYNGLNECYAMSIYDPYIIHYNGHKRPMNYRGVKLQEYFWANARETFIYEDLLINLMGNSINDYVEKINLKQLIKVILKKIKNWRFSVKN